MLQPQGSLIVCAHSEMSNTHEKGMRQTCKGGPLHPCQTAAGLMQRLSCAKLIPVLSRGGGGGIIVLQAQAGVVGVSVTSDTARDMARWVQAGSNGAVCREGRRMSLGERISTWVDSNPARRQLGEPRRPLELLTEEHSQKINSGLETEV